MDKQKNSLIVEYKNEINTQLQDKETLDSLLVTTFKGLTVQMMKRALLEGRMNGFEFTNFLTKDVYAVPFKGSYSLVNSIGYIRKVGQKSGIVGKTEPIYTETEDGKIVTCTVTVKKKFGDYIGDFTATVYFSEYNTGKNQWEKKPRTMIAKVAEMHALRMACPEEMSNMYVEEEYQQDTGEQFKEEVDTTEKEKEINDCKTKEEVQKIWSDLKPEEMQKLMEVKNNKLKSLETIEGELVQ